MSDNVKTVFQLDIHIFLRYVIVKNIKISITLAIFDSFCISNILIHVNLCIHINRLITSYPCLKYTFLSIWLHTNPFLTWSAGQCLLQTKGSYFRYSWEKHISKPGKINMDHGMCSILNEVKSSFSISVFKKIMKNRKKVNNSTKTVFSSKLVLFLCIPMTKSCK